MRNTRDVLLVLVVLVGAEACTTVLVGKGATSDGSILCSHTNDGDSETDPRLVFVPARDHAQDARRPIFYTPESYPRYAGYDRGLPPYYPRDNESIFEPIGYIPEVPHTHQYFEQTYGAINEFQVGFGESTCSCIAWSPLGGKDSEPCQAPGTPSNCALLSIDELTRIALERTTSARDAIALMGSLAEEYGFYGADSFEGSAESLMVIDKNEGWIFHILPHPSGSSAIWAAQKIADDHVAVVANIFVIHKVNLTDSEWFMGSSSMSTIANSYGVGEHCPSVEECDFTATFSDGEYAHKFYSGRRWWGMLRHLSPDTELDPDYPSNTPQWIPYETTYPVDPNGRGFRLNLSDVFNAHRDHYEGTAFSLTEGLAAGPFGNPNRYSGGNGEAKVAGNWERAISIPRTSDSQIVQSRSWLPDAVGGVLHFGPHVPHGTVYTPFPAGMKKLPDIFSEGWQGEMAPETAFWAIRSVSNIMTLKFNYTREDVSDAQTALEASGQELLAKLDEEFIEGRGSLDALTEEFVANAYRNRDAYKDLFQFLLFKYADGWVNVPNLGTGVGYPAWWLVDVGYPKGPPPIDG